MSIRDVNLVDPHILARQKMLRRLRRWMAGLAGLLVLIGGYHQYISRMVTAKKSDAASLERMHRDLSRKIDDIKLLQRDLEALRLRRQLVENLIEKQPYHQVLLKLSDIMNPYTWATQLSLERVESQSLDSLLKLNGASHSNEELGGLLNRFSTERIFADVELRFSREIQAAPAGKHSGASPQRVQFRVECKVLKGVDG